MEIDCNMPFCPIKFCPNNKGRRKATDPPVKSHRFPNGENRDRWEEWVEEVNAIATFVSHAKSRLCARHFSPDSYLPSGRLKKKAVPSVVPELDKQTDFKLGITHMDENSPLVQEYTEHLERSSPCSTDFGPSSSTSSNYNRKAIVGDLNPSDFEKPRRAKRSLSIITVKILKQQQQIQVLQQALRKSQRANANLEALLEDYGVIVPVTKYFESRVEESWSN